MDPEAGDGGDGGGEGLPAAAAGAGGGGGGGAEERLAEFLAGHQPDNDWEIPPPLGGGGGGGGGGDGDDDGSEMLAELLAGHPPDNNWEIKDNLVAGHWLHDYPGLHIAKGFGGVALALDPYLAHGGGAGADPVFALNQLLVQPLALPAPPALEEADPPPVQNVLLQAPVPQPDPPHLAAPVPQPDPSHLAAPVPQPQLVPPPPPPPPQAFVDIGRELLPLVQSVSQQVADLLASADGLELVAANLNDMAAQYLPQQDQLSVRLPGVAISAQLASNMLFRADWNQQHQLDPLVTSFIAGMLSKQMAMSSANAQAAAPVAVAPVEQPLGPKVTGPPTYGNGRHFSQSRLTNFIMQGDWVGLENYVVSFMPQYDVDIHMVHTSLILHIRRGIMSQMMERKEDAHAYFENHILPLEQSISPFVNQGNLLGQINVIGTTLVMRKELGHHYSTLDELTTHIHDYMRMYLAPQIEYLPYNHDRDEVKYYEFFYHVAGDEVRCLMCQRTLQKRAMKDLVRRHFCSKRQCRNLTPDAVLRYQTANPDDERTITILAEKDFETAHKGKGKRVSVSARRQRTSRGAEQPSSSQAAATASSQAATTALPGVEP